LARAGILATHGTPLEVAMALPERRRPLLLGLAFASALVLAGCGSSGDAGGAGVGHLEHAGGTHDMESAAAEPIELPAGAEAPRLRLTATPDAMGGFNLRVSMANFRLAPEHTGGRPVAGEGHLHLYVDGAKHTRLYGNWFYLDGLAPGAHALRVEAVANNHAPYHHGGEPVSATAAVEAG
jgi:hypothetical protein